VKINISQSSLNKLFILLLLYPSYAVGGIYFFYMDVVLKSVYFGLLILIAIYLKRFFKFDFLIVISAIGLIFLFQLLKFGKGTLYNFLGLIVVFGTPYLLLRLFKFKLIEYFIILVKIFAIISLIFWVLVNLSDSFYQQSLYWPELFKTDKWINESYILFSTRDSRTVFNLIRNNGGFWEPGAYATTLIITLIFNVLRGKNLKSRTNIILILAVITTFSTSGWIGLFLIYLMHFNLKYPNSIAGLKNLKIQRIFSLIAILIMIISFDFLGEKAFEQFTSAKEAELSQPTSGRFLGARKSIKGIINDPLFGKYIVQERENPEQLLRQEDLGMYGFFYLIQRIGIIGFCAFILFIYKGFDVLFHYYNFHIKSKRSSFIMILIWLVIMFAQNLYWIPVSLFVFWIGIDASLKVYFMKNNYMYRITRRIKQKYRIASA